MPRKPRRTARGSLWDSEAGARALEQDAQAIETAERERDDAKDELRKEWRDTSRWALVVVIAFVTIAVAISGMALFQVSNLNSELRESRDRLTVLEERLRHLNIPLTYTAPHRDRSQSGTTERFGSLF